MSINITKKTKNRSLMSPKFIDNQSYVTIFHAHYDTLLINKQGTSVSIYHILLFNQDDFVFERIKKFFFKSIDKLLLVFYNQNRASYTPLVLLLHQMLHIFAKI